MSSRTIVYLWFVVLSVALAGCNSWEGDSEDMFDDDLSELGMSTESGDDMLSDSEANPSPGFSSGTSVDGSTTLVPGARFPLFKSVERTLSQSSQSSPQGMATSRSNLDLLMTLSVEENAGDKCRLRVKYDRVRFREIVAAGSTLEYDSANPQYPVPTQVQAYHGLVNNLGFSFWLSGDNHVHELVGFEGFLKQCLRDLPYEEQSVVLSRLAQKSAEERLGDFLDDSIGLVPLRTEDGSPIRVGHAWQTRKTVTDPVPMYVSMGYSVSSINGQEATISILGTITPPAPSAFGDSGREPIRVSVQGGQCHGNCVIDLRTGLPIRSRVERYIDMQVQAAENIDFKQSQHTVTTLSAVSERPSEITPATYQRASLEGNGQREDRGIERRDPREYGGEPRGERPARTEGR